MNRTVLVVALAVLAAGLVSSLGLNCAQSARMSRAEREMGLMGKKLDEMSQRANMVAPPVKEGEKAMSPTELEIQRRLIWNAFQTEEKDFNDSHHNMGGGSISYAMLRNAQFDLESQWNCIATNWFYSTAGAEAERRLMKEYGVGVADMKYTREELRMAMYAWRSVSSGKGLFENKEIEFKNGVAVFSNETYECAMELKLRRDRIWVHEGNVYLFASSDVAVNDGYGASDSLCRHWFMRFKGGRIANYCPFKYVDEDLRFHFEPDNDCIVITSTKNGDIDGELYLGLREHTDKNGKKSCTFEYSRTMAPKVKDNGKLEESVKSVQ